MSAPPRVDFQVHLAPVLGDDVLAALDLGREDRRLGSAGGGSASLTDPDFAPLWLALDDDAAFVFLHPGMSPDARLRAFYLHNLSVKPIETGLAAAQLGFATCSPLTPRCG